jgi:hypothetical protein
MWLPQRGEDLLWRPRVEYCRPGWEDRLRPSWGLSPTPHLKLHVSSGLKGTSHELFNEEIVRDQCERLF